MLLTQNYCMHTQTLYLYNYKLDAISNTTIIYKLNIVIFKKGFSFLLKKEIKFECIVGLGCEFYLRSVGYVLFVM